jgi:hypothetical protein
MSYDELQSHTFQEATKLAASGEEFSHLVKLLNPEFALRLKIFVQSLPDDIASKSIYGASVIKQLVKPKSKPKKSR